jgi:hypothetical protein
MRLGEPRMRVAGTPVAALMIMKDMTKLFALGGAAAVGAGVLGVVKMAKRRAAKKAQQHEIDEFDFTDLDEPVVVTEEVIVITPA